MSDPYEVGPPEYQPDEEPGDDDRALWAEAAAELAEWEPFRGPGEVTVAEQAATLDEWTADPACWINNSWEPRADV